jgi:dTDP-4-amino-4,6-dideoxygalactose transaminase
VAPGFKSNMSDIVASIGLVQLQRAWNLHRRRAQLWAAYDHGLAGLPILAPPQAAAGDLHAMHLYCIRLRDDAPLNRDAFVTAMAKLGVNCGVHFIPLHLHSYWRDKLALSDAMFPSAQRAFEQEVSLPLFTRLTDEKQQFIIQSIQQLLA